MSRLSILFFGNGLNDPGEQVALRVIEIVEPDDNTFGLVQSFFRMKIGAHTNVLFWSYEWLFYVVAILDTSHVDTLCMEWMCFLVKCARFGKIRLAYLAIATPSNLDEIGYFHLLANNLGYATVHICFLIRDDRLRDLLGLFHLGLLGEVFLLQEPSGHLSESKGVTA